MNDWTGRECRQRASTPEPFHGRGAKLICDRQPQPSNRWQSRIVLARGSHDCYNGSAIDSVKYVPSVASSSLRKEPGMSIFGVRLLSAVVVALAAALCVSATLGGQTGASASK